MLKTTDEHFQQFGEIYFSTVFPGAVKAWHRHQQMTLCYAVPTGRIKFVMYDDRLGSPTYGEVQELFLGPENYHLVVVPPLIWNGFKGIDTQMSLVANCATIPHVAGEIERIDPTSPLINYDWGIVHR
jgi:dTDP-4-dehydrorhamnose 3,5-epimerase